MQISNKIIDTAGKLFDAYGIKAVSIHNIASQLHISRSAIYEQFQNKRMLVFACICAQVEKGIDALEKAEEHSESPLETILYINAMTLIQTMKQCPEFHIDLENYPEAKLKLYDKYVSLIWSKYVGLFFKCIEEKLFLPDVDLHMLLDFLMQQPKTTFTGYYAGNDYNLSRYINTTITFLSGVSTDLGRSELNRLKAKDFFNL